jgi:hypothetical protein
LISPQQGKKSTDKQSGPAIAHRQFSAFRRLALSPTARVTLPHSTGQASLIVFKCDTIID